MLSAAWSGCPDCRRARSRACVRRHLGVVFDIGHQSVQFEDIAQSLALLRDRGIPIFKLQAAAALWVPHVHRESVRELRPFTDTIYLSQTTQRATGTYPVSSTSDRRHRGMERHPTPGCANGAPTSTCRCSWTTSARSRPRARGSKPRCACMPRRRVRSSRDRDVHLGRPAAFKTGDITDYVTREIGWTRDELDRHSPGDSALAT